MDPSDPFMAMLASPLTLMAAMLGRTSPLPSVAATLLNLDEALQVDRAAQQANLDAYVARQDANRNDLLRYAESVNPGPAKKEVELRAVVCSLAYRKTSETAKRTGEAVIAAEAHLMNAITYSMLEPRLCAAVAAALAAFGPDTVSLILDEGLVKELLCVAELSVHVPALEAMSAAACALAASSSGEGNAYLAARLEGVYRAYLEGKAGPRDPHKRCMGWAKEDPKNFFCSESCPGVQWVSAGRPLDEDDQDGA